MKHTFISRLTTTLMAGIVAIALVSCNTNTSQKEGNSEQSQTTEETATVAAMPLKVAIEGKFQLPDLPYAADALEPVMGRETVELHYGKHYAGYLKTLNALIKDTDFEQMTLVEIVKASEGKLFNQAGQSLNHYYFFLQMAPEEQAKKQPEGKLAEAIEKTFGSFEEFKEKFQSEAASVFGSGWTFLAYDKEGNLVITKTQNADNPVTKDQEPLLAVDVWEHSYYLDYRNVRADYLKNIWKIIDWSVIEQRYDAVAK
ncbi:MAG: superoxide dismutase [Porphyromonas sp.]|nr:superoxide dismutase [Porphyromonas sp.]